MKNFKDKSPMGRLVEQKEVAASALYLLSDLSSMVTGEILHVDGGYHTQG
jgi:enoyl-[acyl-carrier protein] reductase I